MTEKPEKTKNKPAEAEEKSAKAEEKPAETEQKSAETMKTPAAAPKKPLEKMTVKELKEMAKDMPQIVGVHGMKKEDLISPFKRLRALRRYREKRRMPILPY